MLRSCLHVSGDCPRINSKSPEHLAKLFLKNTVKILSGSSVDTIVSIVLLPLMNALLQIVNNVEHIRTLSVKSCSSKHFDQDCCNRVVDRQRSSVLLQMICILLIVHSVVCTDSETHLKRIVC